MHNSKPLPPLEFLQEKLSYCPETGVLTWKVGNGCLVKAGDKAGTTADGYTRIGLKGRVYKAHRLAWKLHYGTDPVGQVDHRNGNGFDNRISNLREATHSQNMWNQARPDKGVSFCGKQRKKWKALVAADNVTHRLGSFETKEEALEAVRAKREELHGEFARHA